MCGIVAGLTWTGIPTVEAVKRGLATLHHRGPDGIGLWRSPGGQATLGHAQLQVMDPLTGQQPIANESGHIQAVINGEFYDWERIRRELERRNHYFHSQSDSEILVHLYEEFGLACLDHLRGEYAFVLWDERQQVLWAARDRFGSKPLFYSEQAGILWIASEIKALQAAGVPIAWDAQGFFEKLVLFSPLPGRTLFRQVAELPPAHSLVSDQRQTTVRRYWDFNYPPEQNSSSHHSVDEAAAQLEALLDEAVRIRLQAAVPVACFLSGGLDSSSVLGLMNRHLSYRVDAFSLTFDDPEYDEGALACETAHHLQAQWIPVAVTEAKVVDHLEDTVWHGETFFVNGQCVAKFLLSKAVQQAGYRVVLTGEGADEIWGGYPWFLIDAVRSGEAGLAAPTPWLPSFGATSPAFTDRLGYGPAWHEMQEPFLEVWQELLPPEWNREIVRHHFLDHLDVAGQLRGRSILHQSMYLYAQTVLPGHILTVMGDRMEMAHSIEARLPFLDHHLVEFSRSVASSQKIQGMSEKFLLRKAMRLVVPPAACGRRKKPLQSPSYIQRVGPMRNLLQDTVRSQALEYVPFLQKRAVLCCLDRFRSDDPATSAVLESSLMALLTACLLGRRFHLS